MKKYFKIEVGGRGGVEEVEIIESNDMESIVKKRFDDFVNDGEGEEDWKSYVEEFGCLVKKEWGWYIGLGEEDSWFVCDMESKEYLDLKDKLDEIYGEGWSLRDVEDELYEFMGELDY